MIPALRFQELDVLAMLLLDDHRLRANFVQRDPNLIFDVFVLEAYIFL